MIRRPVVSIKKLQSGEIEIVTNSSSNEFGYNASSAKTYDFVVLAAPQTADAKYRIDFKGFDQEIKFLGKYHKTVCTLVEGRLAESYFPTKDSFIDEILTTKEGLLFNSIGQITPVDYTPEYNKSNVWKIFTQKKLKDNELLSIFSEVKNKHVREWLAYPHYESRHFLKNDSFIISSNLYYINAIEWAASAMEMSAIAAKNVALLIHKNFRSNKIDQNTASISKINKNFLIDKTEL